MYRFPTRALGHSPVGRRQSASPTRLASTSGPVLPGHAQSDRRVDHRAGPEHDTQHVEWSTASRERAAAGARLGCTGADKRRAMVVAGRRRGRDGAAGLRSGPTVQGSRRRITVAGTDGGGSLRRATIPAGRCAGLARLRHRLDASGSWLDRSDPWRRAESTGRRCRRFRHRSRTGYPAARPCSGPSARRSAEYPTSDRRGLGQPKDPVAVGIPDRNTGSQGAPIRPCVHSDAPPTGRKHLSIR